MNLAPNRGPSVHIFAVKSAAAKAAADAGARVIRQAIKDQGSARIMVGTGNSQLEMIEFLVKEPGIAWSKVVAFHLDEYVGMAADHPASFRLWLRNNFAEKVRPKEMHYINGDAPDLSAMVREYSAQLLAAPVDLAFVGIGENGHIAFNDPPVADFADPLTLKVVVLDELCRKQQVGEGHFPDMGSVPREAISVTCTGLMRAKHWVCCVPDERKAKAVHGALEGPLTTACPASIVRHHPSAEIFLDAASASLLTIGFVQSRAAPG